MKRPINEMKVVFPSLSENERFARIAVSGFLSFIDPKIDELADIKTAVSEAVTNCIVHGYHDSGEGTVAVTVRLLPEDMIYVRIADKGCGIADIEQAMQPLWSSAPAEERAGLGFTVMQSFTDRLAVTSRPGRGTAVTMRKKLLHGSEQETGG